jgi:hypothetical protein
MQPELIASIAYGRQRIRERRMFKLNHTARILAICLSATLTCFLGAQAVLGLRLQGQGTIPERITKIEANVDALHAIDAHNAQGIVDLGVKVDKLTEKTDQLAATVNRILGVSSALGALLLIAQIVDYFTRKPATKHERRSS